jgi:hypothetical protein
MKFFYILNNIERLIEVGKIDSDRGKLIKLLTYDFKESDLIWCKLYPINFNLEKIKEMINDLLLERKSKPLDIPDYEGRFLESEIFEIKQFEEKELKLCNTGFDNQLIFLINIYNRALKNESPYYLIFTNNHREFEIWKNSH